MGIEYEYTGVQVKLWFSSQTQLFESSLGTRVWLEVEYLNLARVWILKPKLKYSSNSKISVVYFSSWITIKNMNHCWCFVIEKQKFKHNLLKLNITRAQGQVQAQTWAQSQTRVQVLKLEVLAKLSGSSSQIPVFSPGTSFNIKF